MQEEYEIVIEDDEEYKIKIYAKDMKDAIEKFKNFINICYKKEIFLEELNDDYSEDDIEILEEDDFSFDEELEDLDDVYNNKMINLLFNRNKPKQAIIVDFE